MDFLVEVRSQYRSLLDGERARKGKRNGNGMDGELEEWTVEF